MKEKFYSLTASFIIPVIFLLVAIIVVIVIMSSMGNLVNDYTQLDNSPCHIMVINDTFSQVKGGFGSSTYYYIVNNNGNIYELIAGTNATKIYQWKTIIKGQEYSLKTYKEYAEFCGDAVMVINK